jgi:hypothetical protein
MNFLFPTRLQIYDLVNINSHMAFVVRHECLQFNHFLNIHDCKKEASIHAEVGQKVLLNGKQLPKQD